MSSSAVETVARGGSGSRGRSFIFCEGGGHNRDSGRRGGMVGAMHYNDPRLGPEPKHLPDQCKKNEKAQMPPLPLPALPPLDISPAPRPGPLSARLPPVGSGQDRGGGGGPGDDGVRGREVRAGSAAAQIVRGSAQSPPCRTFSLAGRQQAAAHNGPSMTHPRYGGPTRSPRPHARCCARGPAGSGETIVAAFRLHENSAGWRGAAAEHQRKRLEPR